MPDRPLPRPPRFAQVGRPPLEGISGLSRGFVLLIAMGLLLALLALLRDLQAARQRPVIIEVVMEDPPTPAGSGPPGP